MYSSVKPTDGLWLSGLSCPRSPGPHSLLTLMGSTVDLPMCDVLQALLLFRDKSIMLLAVDDPKTSCLLPAEDGLEA